MKKNNILGLLLISFIFLTACEAKQNTTVESSENPFEKYLKETNEGNSEKVITENIKTNELEFVIPNAYEEGDLEQATIMKNDFSKVDSIEVNKDSVTLELYGINYYKDEDMVVFPVYIINSTDKEISNLKFDYTIDLTQIGGSNLGNYNFNYINTGITQKIPAKSVIPVFIGILGIDNIKNPKTFYANEELKGMKMEVENMIITYSE